MLTVKVLHEEGYAEALHGLSLSYKAEIDRMPARALKLAHLGNGHSKFLESIMLWLEVRAPRFFWQEADTYRISTKQSESTMHTITKRYLAQDDFVEPIEQEWLDKINAKIGEKAFRWLKVHLPEGFLQRRVWVLSYKTLQNVYAQRHTHKLPEWHVFLGSLLPQIAHPDFIQGEKSDDYVDREKVLRELVQVVTEDFPTARVDENGVQRGHVVENITAMIIERAMLRVKAL